MRQLSADLLAVQQVRSPRARVTVAVEARGQNASAPALAQDQQAAQVSETPTHLQGEVMP